MPDPDEARITSAEFHQALRAIGMSQQGFASYTGANERNVRRWDDGQQDIPPWVGPMLELLAERAGVSLPWDYDPPPIKLSKQATR